MAASDVTQKEPFLTGFSKHLYGSAKRSKQRSIQLFRKKALRDSTSSFARLFENILPAAWLAGIDPTQRIRDFPLILVFWAWFAQIIEGNASCSKALSMIQSWAVATGLAGPKGGTSGYCQARIRLPDDFLDRIDARITRSLRGATRPDDLWHGLIVKAFDGTSVQLDDTPANQIIYPQPSGQMPGCGFPVMDVVALINLSNGGWEGHVTGSNLHDSRGAQGLIQLISEGDIVLGDRAFCSYEGIARIRGNAGHCAMRLHQARHAKLDWRRGRRIGPLERLVEWEKPAAQPKTSDLSEAQWAALPGKMTLRYVKIGYEDRNGERRMMVVVTTLLDPVAHPAEDILMLYVKRWDIELRFRDVKTTMGMEIFHVKSPEMAHKTLKMMAIAYNLMRTMMQKGAAEAGKPLVGMSFKGCLDAVTSSQVIFAGPWWHVTKYEKMVDEVVLICAGKLIDIRPFRQESRALKRRPKPFPLLTSPRHVFRESPHKGAKRRAA
jgi:hypothetical protein